MNIYIPSNLLHPSIKRIGYKIVFRRRKVINASPFLNAVSGRQGIEIGGPSLFFDVSLPVYKTLSSLDGLNFARQTIWEGEIDESMDFSYRRRRLGCQVIGEGSDLSNVETRSYDFVLSCHSLEHVANPLKALCEWKRILKPGGFLILAVPNKESIFDHNRPTTTFSHLLADEQSGVDERDLTHLQEILELHDLGRDKAAGSFEDFKARSVDNFSNRGLHHHVFDAELLKDCLKHTDYKILEMRTSYYDHLALCQVGS
jgi:SAM-dependent methyltransferase